MTLESTYWNGREKRRKAINKQEQNMGSDPIRRMLWFG